MDHTLDIMPEKKIAPWLKVMKIFSCGVFVYLLCWGLHPVPLYAGQALSGELHSFINFVKCFTTGQLNDLILENNTDLSCSPHVGTHAALRSGPFYFFLLSVM